MYSENGNGLACEDLGKDTRRCVRWVCQVGVSGGCVRWVCQVGVSGGCVR